MTITHFFSGGMYLIRIQKQQVEVKAALCSWLCLKVQSAQDCCDGSSHAASCVDSCNSSTKAWQLTTSWQHRCGLAKRIVA
jgi:hypothetical protein